RRPGVVDVAANVLGAHYIVSAAVGLAGDHRDLRHRRLAEGKQQFGAMLDEAAVLLCSTWKEAGHVYEGEDWDLEAVTEADKARSLAGGSGVEHARQHHRLVGDNADGAARHARKAGNDVLGIRILDLQEVALIHHLQN